MKNICPYCGKETNFYTNIFFYFCDECFQKWFGFTIEKYKSIENKDEIHKKMFNNYKTNKPFISWNGVRYWYKNDQFHHDNDQPAIIYSDGFKRWYKNGELIKSESK